MKTKRVTNLRAYLPYNGVDKSEIEMWYNVYHNNRNKFST